MKWSGLNKTEAERVDEGRLNGPNKTELDQIDGIRPNKPNKTELDRIIPSGPNWTKKGCFCLSYKRILRVRLDTAENWKLKLKTEKHCSKIIFKCVNSIVGSIFNEKVAEKCILWDPWTVHWYTVYGPTNITFYQLFH